MLELMMKYSGITALIVYGFALFLFLKFRKKEKPAERTAEPEATEKFSGGDPLDLSDEDAVVASLIASIECHNETGKNVRVVSVREIG